MKKQLEPDPPGMKRLLPDVNAWIDPKEKRVVVDGTVCLRTGTLEMFACLTGTKEHESVVAVDVPAYAIHAALTAVGAKAGSPVKFRPTFRPAFGSPIDVTVVWQDDKKQKHVEQGQGLGPRSAHPEAAGIRLGLRRQRLSLPTITGSSATRPKGAT